MIRLSIEIVSDWLVGLACLSLFVWELMQNTNSNSNNMLFAIPKHGHNRKYTL